jgi:hypothetical protein
MNQPNLFWNKKTLNSLIIPTLAGALVVALFFVLLNSASAVQYSKGYVAGKAEWDEFIDNQAESTERLTADGWDLFCAQELHELEEFYERQLDRSDMCNAEWLRHNNRLNAYETIYGYINDDDISWAYEMINSSVFVEEEVP